jgi:hypothetical protein
MFGYNSGKEPAHDLLNAEPAKDKIAGLTDQRMLERHGDLIDPSRSASAARSAAEQAVVQVRQ